MAVSRARSFGARWLGIGVETPYRAWRRVPRDMRSDVVHLARLHEPYGVPLVRRLAAEYAASVLAVPPLRAYVVNTLTYVLVGACTATAMAVLTHQIPFQYLAGWVTGTILGWTSRVLFTRRRAALLLRANAGGEMPTTPADHSRDQPRR